MSVDEQFRISKLQVFNWGTFSGVHEIVIANKGFLFVGRSGAGKTTLLDAFSTLLVPPRWVNFNAAAREGERSSRDRTLVSYVRGAWAEQQEDDSGEIATQYLRIGTTWSALALSYTNTVGKTVVLVQLFWIRGKSNNREELRRHFLIFNRPFDLREVGEFKDVRKLKQQFPEAFSREDFAPYGERFRRILGIDNELALRLLHKTQSAKNLGDLNTFLREFMLDKPETFDAAERLVAEFGELNTAHLAVVTARQQVALLTPARADHETLQSLQTDEKRLQELRACVDSYKETCRTALIETRLRELERDFNARHAEAEVRQAAFDNETAALNDLQQSHRDAGGQQVEDWQTEKRALETERNRRLRKCNDVQTACQKLGWPAPTNHSDFADILAKARYDLDNWPQSQEEYRDQHAAMRGALQQATADFQATTAEVESLRRQSSNVDVRSLRLRARMTSELGIADDALPFAAELIEVLPREAEWRGAIERALRPFALSLIVEERHYAAVSEWVDRAALGERLLYNRVTPAEPGARRDPQPNSLIRKLQIKAGPLASYIATELQHYHDLACVDTLQAFRRTEFALTRQGQIRRGKSRHEKDDRFNIRDQSRWVLGFDNADKRALFEQKALQHAQAVNECNRKLRSLIETSKRLDQRILNCQLLVNIQWLEIDVAPLLDRIGVIDRMSADSLEGNTALAQLARQIATQDARRKQAERELIDVKAQAASIAKEKGQRERELQESRERLRNTEIRDWMGSALSDYFHALDQKLTLDNADRLAHQVNRKLDQEQQALTKRQGTIVRAIEKCFQAFQQQWPMEAGNMDTSIASAPDYLAKLARLETDRLPDYEQRFFDLLRNQSHQNLAALATHISQARKTIFDRLEIVNQSLRNAEFNTGTYLHIDPSDRNLEEVREFRQQIQQALSHAWTDDRDDAETRFCVVRDLVEKLASQDPDKKRWRSLVLDVRLHVEFLGREIDGEGKQVEVYQGGAGKSGGQRQKLATTCLAAALRYQLGGEARSVPQYAPVILDEAFDKADNEFTTQAMTIFERFGFQMIVATPLKSVMTLEPFIGGACFVDITDRRHSGVLLIEYDMELERLKLPDLLAGDLHAAVS